MEDREERENRWTGGVLSFIIMSMAKRGPIYGNQVANRISETTGGAWKPSAGSIYPSLEHLKRAKFLERYEENGKAMYRITPKGASRLETFTGKRLSRTPLTKFVGSLWMDGLNVNERTRFIINSAQRMADSLAENLQNIREESENMREYEVFLMSYEIEIEKMLNIIRNAREDLKNEKEVK